jgi:adenylosuccinate lyase
LWHERDISHSSAERVVLPDSSIGLDYILQKAIGLIDGLVVYPERMLENLNATKGLIFSGQLLLALTNKGLSRETAYDWVQRNAMRVWDEGRDFQELVKADDDIKSQLSVVEIERIFSLDHYLRNVDEIYRRLSLI